MPTLLDPADRGAIIARARRLDPAARPGWGTLDAPRMLCHVADQLRVALGDQPCRFVGSLALRTVGKLVFVYTPLDPPKGKITTVAEMLVAKPGAWADDLARLEGLIERCGRGEARAVHPAFGPMGPKAWGRLGWKHLDYHFRQFGG